MTAACLDQGLIITDVPALPVAPLRQCLHNFMLRGEAYRKEYLQREFDYAFDGYSHYGQVDSSHQAADDLLHSFVFSDFSSSERYPREFQAYIRDEWPTLTTRLRAIELSLLQQLPFDLSRFHRDAIGHMMSANYYPPLAGFDNPAAGNTRLSEHPDVSLLTIFPFGIDCDFEYQDAQGDWHRGPPSANMVAFPGYLLEWLSGGVVKALNHRVRLDPCRDSDRYSFVVFSIPHPNTTLTRSSLEPGVEVEQLSAQAYFQQYTGLWDY